MSKFKFVQRLAKDTILLIPGWAADYRIFDLLDIDYNYLLPLEFHPCKFGEGLLEAMDANGINNISILGWSMGAFVACDLLSKYRNRINEIIFVGARRKYEMANNEKIKGYLLKNREAFLRKFYNDCISEDDKDAHGWFRAHLLKDYLKHMDLSYLIEELDYLSAHQIEPKALEAVKVTFIHGKRDRIAPFDEVVALKEEIPGARLITVENAGHIPFLAPDFKKIM